MDGQGTTWRRNIAENFNRLSRVHQCYRRQTDGPSMTYSERELEFTFAKNSKIEFHLINCYSVIRLVNHLCNAMCSLACLTTTFQHTTILWVITSHRRSQLSINLNTTVHRCVILLLFSILQWTVHVIPQLHLPLQSLYPLHFLNFCFASLRQIQFVSAAKPALVKSSQSCQSCMSIANVYKSKNRSLR